MRLARCRRVVWAALAGAIAVLVAACGPPALHASSRARARPETVGLVPQLIATSSSDALALGLSDAAKRFGGSVFFEGSGSPVPSDQVRYAEELVGRHLSAVGVAATDPASVCPTAQIARRSGVLFYATGSNVDCPGVGLFVAPAPPQAIGADAVDLLAGAIHGAGEVAIVSGAPTEPDLASWIHYMRLRLAAYPRLRLVPVQTGALTSDDTIAVADRLMSAYPDLRGVIGTSSANVTALAAAVDRAGKRHTIAVTGVADPRDVRSAIDTGTVAGAVSYNAVHLGYLTYWAVSRVLHHRAFAAHDTVPGLTSPVTWTPATHTLLLGPPILVTKANVNRLDF